jgi:two-component system, LytTR family, response regulator
MFLKKYCKIQLLCILAKLRLNILGSKISALVVDDEESARLLLRKLLEELGDLSEIRLAASAAEAVTELEWFEPDVIFLDIKMPGKNGFEFINDIPKHNTKPEIVFVTAYDEFALKAIKNQAFDYLLKPVNRKELKICVQRLAGKRQHVAREPYDKLARIRISTRTGTVFLNPATILYCQASGNYCVICTGEKQHFCSLNLRRISELLPPGSWIRLGRSHIINREYLTVLDKKECTITLVRNTEEVVLKVPKQHLKDLDNIG